MGTGKQTATIISRIILVLGIFCLPLVIYELAQAAPTYSSDNYGVDEVFMGAGGLNDASSDNYQARASLGDIVVGNAEGTDYQLYGGFTTTPDPYISLIVTNADVNLGYLSLTEAATTTGTFKVKAYLASGYVVVNAADPPSYTSGGNTHYFDTPSSPTGSVPGTEQFGINLAENTDPTTFGDDPVQIPDLTYSFGQVHDDYDNPDTYMYAKGGTIAYSTKSSGYTQYTVSYVYNISQATPAGEYTFYHIIVATGTY